MFIVDFVKDNGNLDVHKFKNIDTSAIYLICTQNGEIIYVGKTANINTRIRSHNERIEFHGKDFYYFKYPKAKCEKKEKELILKYQPKYNIRYMDGINSHKIPYPYTYSAKNKKQISSYKLNKILQKKKMTQASLAREIGVSRQLISLNLIMGAMSDNILTKICKILKIEKQALL